MSRSQRHVLAAVQDELQADAELAAVFSAFTSVTVGAAMPKFERLPTWRSLAAWRAFLKRRIVLIAVLGAALVAVLALALAAASAGRQTGCDPAYAFAPACHGSSWAPAGAGGHARPVPYRLRRAHAQAHS